MYYCKNTGCITKNALGDRYDDFEKHEKTLIFFDKNRLRISPLDPTERYKHVQTMIQVVFYQKNTGSTTKDALGGGNRQKITNWVKMDFLYVPHRTPIPYRFLKTRANIYKSDIQPKKHVSRVQLSSGGKIVQKTGKFGKFCTF